MKKGIVAGLIVLCVALGAGTAAVVVTDDRKGPEIELPADGDVTYEEGSDTASLLEGVTATDEKDGDVTDSLMIENIFPNDDHTSASVVYAAKDSHNNVSKATRRVNYKAAAEDTPAENEATQETDNSGAADESAPAVEEPQQNERTVTFEKSLRKRYDACGDVSKQHEKDVLAFSAEGFELSHYLNHSSFT